MLSLAGMNPKLWICVGVALAGCARSAPTAQYATTSAPVVAQHDPCPMGLPGASVSTADVNDGAALDFKTTGTDADVADLRARVQRMVSSQNSGGCPMLAEVKLPGSFVSYEEIDHGAAIVFHPRDPAKLDDLRSGVNSEAVRFLRGCPIAR